MKQFSIRTAAGDRDADEIGRFSSVICGKRYFFVVTRWEEQPPVITHIETRTKIFNVMRMATDPSATIMTNAKATLRRAVAHMGAELFAASLDRGISDDRIH